MSLALFPVEALRLRRKWQFAEPIVRHVLDEARALLLHPPTGAWAIVERDHLPVFDELIQAAKTGKLDAAVDADEHPLLAELYDSGLLLKDGRAAWSNARFDHRSAPQTMLILKMVGYCNLACSYCYDFDDDRYKHRLPRNLAEQAITQSLERARDGLLLHFHGGEPMLAWDDIRHLSEYARRQADRLGRKVVLSIQTNGTRFTGENVAYILENHLRLGISLDGPAPLNDHWRVDHNGGGSHARIEAALQRYPKLVERIGILTTVTSTNVRRLIEIAEYVRSLGVKHWDATLFDALGRGSRDSALYAPRTEDVVQAHLDLLDAVDSGRFDDLEVRPVLRFLSNALSYARNSFCLRDGCGAGADLVAIAADGVVQSCDCIRDRSLDLGRLGDVTIEEAMRTQAADSIRNRTTATLAPCRECDWRVFCGGTCLAKASLTTVDPQSCALSMAMFPEIFRRLARSDKLIQYAKQFE